MEGLVLFLILSAPTTISSNLDKSCLLANNVKSLLWNVSGLLPLSVISQISNSSPYHISRIVVRTAISSGWEVLVLTLASVEASAFELPNRVGHPWRT